MAVGNVVLIRDEQSYSSGVQVINQYFYEVSTPASGSGEAEAVVDSFIQNVLPTILAIQTTNVVHTQISGRNLSIPTDFVDRLLIASNVGTAAGNALPPFAAWTFKFQRGTLAVRHGWKRICGVSEDDSGAGVASAGVLTRLTNTAAVMEQTLAEDGGTGLYIPRIVRLGYVGGVLTTIQPFPIADVVYAHIGTQNSRKFGRGA